MSPTPDFSLRSTEPEWMDAEPALPLTLTACLADLARVNRATRAYAPTLRFLDAALPALRALGRPVRVVDIGSGHGDMLRRVAAWGRKRGLPLECIGLDPSLTAIRAASAATPPDAGISFLHRSTFDAPPLTGVDVAITSLVTHHLPDAGIVALLGWMEATSGVGWFVSDLHRHPVAYHGFRLGAWLARLHPYVQHDGPVSIARAFVRDDWRRLVAAAGIETKAVSIEWQVPFRYTVTRLHAP